MNTGSVRERMGENGVSQLQLWANLAAIVSCEQLYSRTAMLVHLRIVFGFFCVTDAELSSCDRPNGL